jgi:hypothetical protein
MGGHEPKHTARGVADALGFQLVAQVIGHHFYVVLQKGDVLKNAFVDALQHIVRRIGLGGAHFVGAVDKAVAQWGHVANGALMGKLLQKRLVVGRVCAHGVSFAFFVVNLRKKLKITTQTLMKYRRWLIFLAPFL